MKAFLKRIFIALGILVLAGQGCTKGLSPETIKASEPVTMNVWGVIDDADVYTPVFQAYQAVHPNVRFEYRRLRLEEYKKELLNALAEDRGPDIFLIHNDWLGEYVPKVAPMPASTKSAYQVVVGTLKKEKTWELRTEPTLSMKAFKDQYADAAIFDLIRTVDVSEDPKKPNYQPRIMGIPVGIDTLALFYNKDLLNSAGIPTPPETWTQFQEQVETLTKLDAQGGIVQSAAGIGTAYNVERGVDILVALMLQNGTTMADENGTPLFHQLPDALRASRTLPPGAQALEFYTDFANPNKKTYTWNKTLPNSLDAFIRGQSAFFFGYSFNLPQIQARAPKINLGISKLPQIENNPSRNVANYWFWVVSKKSQHQEVAWNFLNFLAKPEQSKKVLEAAGRPAALKGLLADQLNREDIGTFASQVLTAVSWYKGRDAEATENAFLYMIDQTVAGAGKLDEIMNFAAQQVYQTL